MSTIDPKAWVDKSAVIRGDVTLGEDVSVWCNAVVRGVGMAITVGKNSNVQDCVILHGDIGNNVTVGANVTLGHGAVIHGCTIEDDVVIGMNAVVLDHAVIGRGSIVGAGAVVPAGLRVPPRSLVVGTPAKVKKELSEDDVAGNIRNADEYRKFSKQQQAEGF
jgi:carbonic anhydrase/acetyltransferase-like protein (isoleucine patch superfamily)